MSEFNNWRDNRVALGEFMEREFEGSKDCLVDIANEPFVEGLVLNIINQVTSHPGWRKVPMHFGRYDGEQVGEFIDEEISIWLGVQP